MTHEFKKIIFGLFEIYDKEATINKAKIYWSMLGQYPVDRLSAAAHAWIRKSRFMPKPADFITLLEGNQRHPSADEAWAIAILADDEANTVVWTQEISRAWALAKIVYRNGDTIGARRTFIEVYERYLNEVLLKNTPMKILISPGTDKEKRRDTLMNAVNSGLILPEETNFYLPAQENTFAMLELKPSSTVSNVALHHIEKIRKMISRYKGDTL